MSWELEDAEAPVDRLESRRPRPRGQSHLILLDVDGVLTDGAVVIYGDGSESKRFHIRDGIALVWAQRAGITVGLLSARHSPTTAQRAAQLGITLIHQGVASKIDGPTIRSWETWC